MPQKGILTLPQKTQRSMFKRYEPNKLLSSSQIKDDVLEDYPDTPRGSVIPSDYCCNKSNKDPQSGIYHIFFYERQSKKYRLLPKLNLDIPLKRDDCPK